MLLLWWNVFILVTILASTHICQLFNKINLLYTCSMLHASHFIEDCWKGPIFSSVHTFSALQETKTELFLLIAFKF
jgi:hypothetical protein